MHKIRAIVVDDEPKSRQVLIELVNMFCPDIEIVGEAGTISTAIQMINEEKPGLVFFDILLQEGDSFEIIKNIKKVDFEMIFVTAFDEDSVKALKFSGAKVLLKPIQIDELVAAVKEIKNQKGKSLLSYQMADGVLKSKFSTLPLITNEGLVFKAIDEILYACKSNKGSNIIFKDGSSTKSERTVMELMSMIDTAQFNVSDELLINNSLIKLHNRSEKRLLFKNGLDYFY